MYNHIILLISKLIIAGFKKILKTFNKIWIDIFSTDFVITKNKI